MNFPRPTVIPTSPSSTGVLCLLASPVYGQTTKDRDDVRRAVLDYVEGFYEGDTAKLVRSIRPEVQKYGFYMPRDSARYVGEAMPWPEFLAYAREVREQGGSPPAGAKKEVTVLDSIGSDGERQTHCLVGNRLPAPRQIRRPLDDSDGLVAEPQSGAEDHDLGLGDDVALAFLANPLSTQGTAPLDDPVPAHHTFTVASRALGEASRRVYANGLSRLIHGTLPNALHARRADLRPTLPFSL